MLLKLTVIPANASSGTHGGISIISRQLMLSACIMQKKYSLCGLPEALRLMATLNRHTLPFLSMLPCCWQQKSTVSKTLAKRSILHSLKSMALFPMKLLAAHLTISRPTVRGDGGNLNAENTGNSLLQCYETKKEGGGFLPSVPSSALRVQI